MKIGTLVCYGISLIFVLIVGQDWAQAQPNSDKIANQLSELLIAQDVKELMERYPSKKESAQLRQYFQGNETITGRLIEIEINQKEFRTKTETQIKTCFRRGREKALNWNNAKLSRVGSTKNELETEIQLDIYLQSTKGKVYHVRFSSIVISVDNWFLIGGMEFRGKVSG